MEEYYQQLYGFLASKDSEFAQSFPDAEAFNERLQDQEYAASLRDFLASKDSEFAQKYPDTKAFYDRVKKKEIASPTESLSDDSTSNSEVVQEQESIDTPTPINATSATNESGVETTVAGQPTEGNDNFERVLSEVNPELIGLDEEPVVAKMNYMFKDYGFEFEETGIRDYMKVTSVDEDGNKGEQIEIKLDPWINRSSVKTEESEKLKQFLSQNKREIKSTEKRDANVQKIINEQELEERKAGLNKTVESFISDVDKLAAEKVNATKELEKKFGNKNRAEIARNPEMLKEYQDLQGRIKEINNQTEGLLDRKESILEQEKELKMVVGDYTSMKAKQGTFWGAIQDQFLGYGERAASSLTSTSIDLLVEMGIGADPEYTKEKWVELAKKRGVNVSADMSVDEVKSILEDEGVYSEVNAEAKDILKKEIKYGKESDSAPSIMESLDDGLTSILGDAGINDEKMAQMQDESIFYVSMFGVAESLPAMIGMHPVQRVAQFYMLGSDHIDEEMEGMDVTENEKQALKLSAGAVVAVLEEYGLRNIIAQKGLLNGFLARALNKSGSSASAKTFQEFVRQDVKSAIARGALTITAGGLAEFETGMAQEFSDISAKKIFNAAKGQELFKGPNGVGEWASQIIEAGVSEAIGGLVIGTPGGIVAAMNNNDVEGIPEYVMNIFEEMSKDPEYVGMYVTSLKQRIATGKTTKEEAKKELAHVRQLMGIMPEIPTELSTEKRKKALSLLFEKAAIKRDIKGKDKALVKKELDRIEAIDKEIEELPTASEGPRLSRKERFANLLERRDAFDEKISDLIQEEDALFERIEALAEIESRRDLTQEEQAEFDGLKNQKDVINEEISSLFGKRNEAESALDKMYEESAGRLYETVYGEAHDLDEGFFQRLRKKFGMSSKTPVESSSEASVLEELFGGEDAMSEGSPEGASMLSDRILKAKKAIKAIMPEVRIETLAPSDIAARFGEKASKAFAFFDPNTNTIVFNKDANPDIALSRGAIPHEVMHAVIHNAFKSKLKGKQRQVADRALSGFLEAIKKVASPELLAQIDKVMQEDYQEGQSQNEERIAQLFGVLSKNYQNFSIQEKSAVREFINKVLRLFGFNAPEKFTQRDKDVLGFMETLAKKIESGEEIVGDDIQVLVDLGGGLDVDVDVDVSEMSDEAIEYLIIGAKGASKIGAITNYNKARIAEAAYGMSAEDIYNATGWYRGVDGQWKYEVDPIDMPGVAEFASLEVGQRMMLERILGADNPIFKMYPNLSGILVKKTNSDNSYNRTERVIKVSNGELHLMLSKNYKHIASVLTHEIQHHIQYEEGFNIGASPDAILYFLKDDVYKKVLESEVRAFRKGITLENKNLENAYEVISALSEEDIDSDLFEEIAKEINSIVDLAEYGDNYDEYVEGMALALGVDEDVADRIVSTLHISPSNMESVDDLKDYYEIIANEIKERIAIKYAIADDFKNAKTNFEERSAVNKMADWGTLYSLYLRSAGEVEARLAQQRREMTARERAISPIMDAENRVLPRGRQFVYGSWQETIRNLKTSERLGSADMLSGTQEGNPSTPSEIQYMTASPTPSITDIVAEARGKGVSDPAIRDYLMRVMKFSSKQVDQAMKVASIDGFIPKSFLAIKAGLESGRRLFLGVETYYKTLKRNVEESGRLTDVELRKAIRDFTNQARKKYDTVQVIKDKVEARKKDLAQKGKSDAEIKSLVNEYRKELFAERNKVREEVAIEIDEYANNLISKNNKENPLTSDKDILDDVLAYLMEQPAFKGEGNENGLTTESQAQMILDLQKYLGINPNKKNSERISKLRSMLYSMRRKEISLRKVKNEMLQALRTSLPKAEYSKAEVLSLAKKIAIATEKNLENLMGELEELVVKKGIQSSEKNIKDILDGKYTTMQGSRKKGAKIDPRTLEILLKAKSLFKDSYAEAADIQASIDTMVDRLRELSNNSNPTDAEVMEGDALGVAILYNSSLLMANGTSKATTLAEVESNLQELVEYGRSALSEMVAKDRAEYIRQFDIAYQDILGEDIDLSGDDRDAILDDLQRKHRNKEKSKRIGSVLKRLTRQVIDFLDTNIIATAEAMDGLMDRISKLPGEMFGGRLQELVTNRIDESSRQYKARMMTVETVIMNKYEQIYGKKWRKHVRKNRVATRTGIYIDQSAVDRAKRAVATSPTKENKRRLKEVLAEQELVLSQNEMYYLRNQYKDPSNHPSFATKYGSEQNAARIMGEMEAALTDQVREWADWQMNVFFPNVYGYYNDVYQKIYRTNLPWNAQYAGRIYREGLPEHHLDLLSGGVEFNQMVGAESTKSRVNNNVSIKDMDGDDALLSYARDMEYFAAYAESVRDINKLFSNDKIVSAITSIHGQKVLNLITASIQKIARKGVENGMWNSFVNSMNDMFILSRLGLSPGIMIKQLSSFITYANDIGYRNWVYHSAKNIPELMAIYKEVRDNSVYMQDRTSSSLMHAIESYTGVNEARVMASPAKDFFTNVLMSTTKLGDAGAIYLGGLPNYSYYKAEFKKKNPTATEQEAINHAIVKFERDTKRTQQSGDLQDKDFFQTSNPIVRSLNMFMTTPKQYFRKEIQASRSLLRKLKARDKNAGKGTIWQNMRTLLTYHVVTPMFFQYLSLGLPGLLRDVRDDDDEDMLRAAIIGNLNALFIIGEVVTALGDYFTGKPWAGDGNKTVGLLTYTASVFKKAKRADKIVDPEKRAQRWKEFWFELMTITRLPAPTLARYASNYDKLLSGDTDDMGETILRILNYSEYQIEGSQEKSKSSKRSGGSVNKGYLKENNPDIYNDLYGPDGIMTEMDEIMDEVMDEVEEDMEQ
jgi:hypothetical protein